MRNRRLLALLPVVALSLTAPAVAHAGEAERLPAGLVVAEGAPATPEVSADAWLVADLDTGEVLAANDAHAQHPPASTIKLLTAYALLPEVARNEMVQPTQEEIDVEGSKVGLLRDVAYPAEELYQSLLMVSGNDAANALAGEVGGVAAAVDLMNRAARRVGALDTNAVTPHGLDADGQVSTAYDLAAITRAALRNTAIAQWVAMRKSTVSARPGEPRFEIYNKNKLLAAYEGALGVKTGYTRRSGASFIGAAERDGRRVVITMLRSEPRFWDDAEQLLDWGFTALAAGAEPVGALPALPESAPAATPASRELTAAQPADGGFRWPELPAVPVRPLAGGLLVVLALAAVRPARTAAARRDRAALA